MSKLSVTYNGVPHLEYDRNRPLEDHQALYLDKMDEKMDAGITIGDQYISNPDINQRAQFVAANLAYAIKTDHEASMASLCSYLAMRLPDIHQITINDHEDEGMEIDFRFDAEDPNVVFVAPPTRQ